MFWRDIHHFWAWGENLGNRFLGVKRAFESLWSISQELQELHQWKLQQQQQLLQQQMQLHSSRLSGHLSGAERNFWEIFWEGWELGDPQTSPNRLSSWWFGTWLLWLSNTFHILGMSSSQLTFIFFRGVGIPPTSYFALLICGVKWDPHSITGVLRHGAKIGGRVFAISEWSGHRTTSKNQNSPLNHHEITMKSPWNHHETTIPQPYPVNPRNSSNLHGICWGRWMRTFLPTWVSRRFSWCCHGVLSWVSSRWKWRCRGENHGRHGCKTFMQCGPPQWCLLVYKPQ